MITEAQTSLLSTDSRGLEALLNTTSELLGSFLDQVENAPASGRQVSQLERDMLEAFPSEGPTDHRMLLERSLDAGMIGFEAAGPRFLAGIPGGGLVEAGVGELVSMVLNRFVAFRFAAPGLVAIEEGLIRWMAALFGLPSGSGGLLTTGGSQAILTMMIGARQRLTSAGGRLEDARLYVSEEAHACVAKAAHIAGLPASTTCVVPTKDGLHFDPQAADEAIRRDREAGLHPFLLVATAGTTNTGCIDPLAPLAAVARAHDLWFHVDACYGGFFILTERGRARLSGIELADSISVDPHKSLFLPSGSGALIVQNPHQLAEAHRAGKRPTYLRDVKAQELPDYSELGLELTRDARGLRMWLPLHVHGIAAFRAALDEKLDLARYLHENLAAIPRIEILSPPELSIVLVRVAGEDQLTTSLAEALNASGQFFCATTVFQNRLFLRICVLNFRTRRSHVEELLQLIRKSVADLP